MSERIIIDGVDFSEGEVFKITGPGFSHAGLIPLDELPEWRTMPQPVIEGQVLKYPVYKVEEPWNLNVYHWVTMVAVPGAVGLLGWLMLEAEECRPHRPTLS